VILTEGSFEGLQVDSNSSNCVDIYNMAITQSGMFQYCIVSCFIMEVWVLLCWLLRKTAVLVSVVYCMCCLRCTLCPMFAF
jgi:hypothetical protein